MVSVESVESSPSPLLEGSVRLSARVRAGNQEGLDLWFDVPEALAGAGAERGEAWLSLLLPWAAERGEDLTIPLPVDPMLLDRSQDLQHAWKSWRGWPRAIGVDAPAADSPPAGSQRAVFFSGGVDSFFTLLRSVREEPEAESPEPHYPRIDSLITVWGFDIPLTRPDDFADLRRLVERSAKAFGKRSVFVATNLKAIEAIGAGWGKVYHGPALAAVAHLLSDRFREVFIASTHDYSRMKPWGSHALTDPLFSSSRLRIVYDGAGTVRSEKVRRVVSNPTAAQAVRVCWEEGRAGNCSACAGCLRTMATIDVLGLKSQAPTFDWSEYSVDRVRRVFQDPEGLLPRELADVARRRGREDIASAMEDSQREAAVWEQRKTRLYAALERLLPEPKRALFIDEDTIRLACPAAERLVPFLERDGVFAGRPADDAAAIAELERRRAAGVEYVAFVWPAFWWRDCYPGFASHVAQTSRLVHDDDALALYRLDPSPAAS